MSTPESIIVDGVEYVKKSAKPAFELSDDCVIVRTRSAGVFAGKIQEQKGQEVTLVDARRLWYWDGAASLSQLAMEGTSKPEKCKFPCIVPRVWLPEVIEIIPCTEKARESISKVKVWEA